MRKGQKIYVPSAVQGGAPAAFLKLVKSKVKKASPYLCHNCGKRSEKPFPGKLCEYCVLEVS